MNNDKKINQPHLVTLKREHATLSNEVHQLNKELMTLKGIIRNKQKTLRIVRGDIINKAYYRSPLRAVSNYATKYQPLSRTMIPIKKELKLKVV